MLLVLLVVLQTDVVVAAAALRLGVKRGFGLVLAGDRHVVAWPLVLLLPLLLLPLQKALVVLLPLSRLEELHQHLQPSSLLLLLLLRACSPRGLAAHLL